MQEHPNLNKVLESDNPINYLVDYAKKNNIGRLNEEWEEFILSLEDPWETLTYIIVVIKNKWIQAEEILQKNAEVWNLYQCNIPRWERFAKIKQDLIEGGSWKMMD